MFFIQFGHPTTAPTSFLFWFRWCSHGDHQQLREMGWSTFSSTSRGQCRGKSQCCVKSVPLKSFLVQDRLTNSTALQTFDSFPSPNGSSHKHIQDVVFDHHLTPETGANFGTKNSSGADLTSGAHGKKLQFRLQFEWFFLNGPQNGRKWAPKKIGIQKLLLLLNAIECYWYKHVQRFQQLGFSCFLRWKND